MAKITIPGLDYENADLVENIAEHPVRFDTQTVGGTVVTLWLDDFNRLLNAARTHHSAASASPTPPVT